MASLRRSHRSSQSATSRPCVRAKPYFYRLIRRARIFSNRRAHVVVSVGTTAILLVLIYATTRTTSQSKSKWLLGVSKGNITPTERVWLSGFESRNHTADSLIPLDPTIPLYVRAISLQPSGEQVRPFVIVTLDAIGLHLDVSNDIYTAVESEIGLSRNQLRFVASHTHSGPVIGRNLAPLVPDDEQEWAKIGRYELQLKQNVVEAVRDALEKSRLMEVTARFGKGVAALAVNRLQISEKDFDGTTRGDTDKEVPVLWFTSMKGNIVAGLYGYSAHPTVLTGEFRYSGDYPAVTSAALEQKFENSTWSFLPGCAGDQNIYPRGAQTYVRQHGNALATAVMDVVLGKETGPVKHELNTTLAYKSIQIALPFATRLSRKELRQLRRHPRSYGRRAGEALLRSLKSDGSTSATYPYPIAAANIGGLQFAFLGGEPTIGYCHSLRARGADWVVGYADDVMGYVPMDAIMEGDGRKIFERTALYYGLPSVWRLGAENAIVTETGILLQKILHVITR